MHACIHTLHTHELTYINTYLHACIHTFIQTYRQTNMQTYRHIDIQTEKQTDRRTDRQTDRQTHRHTAMHTYSHTDLQTDRQTDRQTNINTHLFIFLGMYLHTPIYMLVPRSGEFALCSFFMFGIWRQKRLSQSHTQCIARLLVLLLLRSALQNGTGLRVFLCKNRTAQSADQLQI